MQTREIKAKSILSASGIPSMDYCVNPYIGCGHGCRYCYADFMKKYTGHFESEWGSFVDIKINAAELLMKEVTRKRRGQVFISSVTDPYQPLEAKFKLTRQCLEILFDVNWPVSIQTKSPLVTRDIDLIQQFKNIEVGITISTDSEEIKKKFESNAPSIDSRLKALKQLKESGIKTYAFVGPILPMKDARGLAQVLRDVSGTIFLDRMNYVKKSEWIYRKNGFLPALKQEYFDSIYKIFHDVARNKVENV